MEDPTDGIITKTIISVQKTLYDDEIITITTKNSKCIILEKIAKSNDLNVYESSNQLANRGSIQWDTNFGPHIFIHGDDLDYNHVNDMCPNYCQKEFDERMFSVFICGGKAAVTIFIMPIGG